MIDPRLTDFLLSRESLDLDFALSCAGLEDDPVSLAEFIELASRLPTGLVHADTIWLLSRAPADATSLAPESAWFVMDRALVAEVPRLSDGARGLLSDLTRYALVARHLTRRFAAAESHASPSDWSALMVAQLAIALDADPADLEAFAKDQPGLASDLIEMARGGFAPKLLVHADLRPDRLIHQGATIAHDVLERVPVGPIRLVVSDSAAVVDVLSPYVRDLGHALTQWGLENPSRLRTVGLVEALQQSRGTPQDDLTPLVAADLLRDHPDLLEERRQAERSQGLALTDHHRTTFGHADLGRLDAPDRGTVSEGTEGTLVVLAGGAPRVLVAAARAVLESGRVSGIATVEGVPAAEAEVFVSAGVLGDDDAVAFADPQHALAQAERLAIRTTRAGPLTAGRRRCQLSLQTGRAVSRARVQDKIGEKVRHIALFHSVTAEGTNPSLLRARTAVSAARVALAAILDDSSPDPESLKPDPPRLSRRFRA